MSHYSLLPLHGPGEPVRQVCGPGSAVYLSEDETANTAVVFVHGWNGHPIATWTNFARFIRTRKEYKKCDVYFWGYNSLEHQIEGVSYQLRQFIATLFSVPTLLLHPKSDILPSKPIVERLPYRRLILVCHSAGAVIARHALYENWKARVPYSSRCELVLFAPAHSGARVFALIAWETGWLGLARGLINYLSPIAEGLKQDSPFLIKLQSDIEATIRASPRTVDISALKCLAARMIVHALNDKVVKHSPFLTQDASAIFEPAQTHSSVCKPNINYVRPAILVGGVL